MLLNGHLGTEETGSGVKNTGCSSRGPGSDSQHLHGSLQVSVTLVPGTTTLSCRNTCRQNADVHDIKINYLKWAFRDDEV